MESIFEYLGKALLLIFYATILFVLLISIVGLNEINWVRETFSILAISIGVLSILVFITGFIKETF